jgi:hypothetical protein
MNGCLFKILLVMLLVLGFLMGLPHLKKYASQSMQAKISNFETKKEVVTKFIKIISNKKLTENQENDQRNDNIEDQETGE